MKKADQSRFPIGEYEYGKTYTLEETRRHIKTIERLPKNLKKILKKLKGGSLDKSYRKGGWNVRQIVNHLVDSHLNAYVRMKLALTEPTPVVKPYEEASWAETEDGKNAPVKQSVKLLSLLHRRWVQLLSSLSQEDLEKGYFHPGMQRVVFLPDAIAAYAWHSAHHLAHIDMVANGIQHDVDKTTTEKAGEDTAPKKRGPKAKADKPAAPTDKPKRVLSPEHLAKLAAARAARKGASATTTTAAAEPKKRGPKAKADKPVTAPTAEPKKRGPKAKADKPATATATGDKPKRVLSPEHLAKLAAGRAARKGASAQTATPAAEPKKRGPKPKATTPPAAEPKKRGPKAKADKPATATATGDKPKRVLSPEHLAKLAAGRAARKGASAETATPAAEPKKRGPKAKATTPPVAEPKKRGPKAKADKPATATATGDKPKRVLSPEHLAKLAAGRASRKGASAETATPAAEPKKRGPKAKADKPAKAEKTGDKPKRVLSPEHLAKLAAGRASRKGASAETATPAAEPKKRGPKAKADKPAKAEKTGDKPKRVLSPEHLAKLAAGRANRKSKKED